MILTPAQADAIIEHAKANGISPEEAAKALGIELAAGASSTAAPASTDKPWSAAVAKDTRIPLEQAAAFLVRNEGMSEEQALKQVIHMNPADYGPLAEAEAKRFAERAEVTAEQDWRNSPAGIEAMGRERQAQAAADAERAAAIAVELAARGLPVEGASTEDILGIIDGLAAEREEARLANDLNANIQAATGGDGQ